MPQPSSLTRMESMPPPLTSTAMREAPASRAFSMSSLTTEAGRSTTSPAAIRAATSGGRTRMVKGWAPFDYSASLRRARLRAGSGQDCSTGVQGVEEAKVGNTKGKNAVNYTRAILSVGRYAETEGRAHSARQQG